MAQEKNGVNPGATPEMKVELLSANQAAVLLGISPQRTRHLLRKGVLPGTRLGGAWVVPRQALEKYIADLYKSAKAHYS